jgi:diaminopimelate epimerase
MLIYNADGSQVEMCGNGIRCLARYAFERGHTKKRSMTVETLAGIRRPVIARGNVRVDMGAPVLDAAHGPHPGKGRVIDHPFSLKSPKNEVDLRNDLCLHGKPPRGHFCARRRPGPRWRNGAL